MTGRATNIVKNRNYDRILVLKKMEGKSSRNSSGLIDNSLFTGSNRLHAIMNLETCIWYLKYDSGILPEPLKQGFTSFTKLLAFVTDYFKRRNIDIEKVID